MDRACLLPSSQAMTNVNNLYLPHASQPSEAETQIVAAATTEHWHATVSSPRPNKGYIIGWYMYRYSTASFAMAQLKNVPCSRSSVCPSVRPSAQLSVCLCTRERNICYKLPRVSIAFVHVQHRPLSVPRNSLAHGVGPPAMKQSTKHRQSPRQYCLGKAKEVYFNKHS